MKLTGSLEGTTLGDLFGALYRERVSGTLELEEERGPAAARTHSVHFRDGRVVGVDSSLGARPLGELLFAEGALDHRALDRVMAEAQKGRSVRMGRLVVTMASVPESSVVRALRKQRALRLEALFAIKHARVRFRVPKPAPAGCPLEPMGPLQFLHGRSRARTGEARTSRAVGSQSGERERALLKLGLRPGASMADVRRRFRCLAAQTHPDAHHGSSAEVRSRLATRFAELSNAYHKLAV